MSSSVVDYLQRWHAFFDYITQTTATTDPLPLRVASYYLSEDEILGQIVDCSIQYLYFLDCPSDLLVQLARIVVNDVVKEIPTHLKEGSSDVVEPLKVMQAVSRKVAQTCQYYLDNANLCRLPAPVPEFIVSARSVKHTRRTMEDRIVYIQRLHALFGLDNIGHEAGYYAVFDGHNGTDAAAFACSHLHQFLVQSKHYPQDIFKAFEDAYCQTEVHFLRKRSTSGTTSLAVLHEPSKERLVVSWLGDSQAMIIRGLGNRLSTYMLSQPHRPQRPDELKRIESEGGFVLNVMGVHRVQGEIAVARAFGCARFKPYVSPVPDIGIFKLDGTEEVLVLGCDGFWDVVDIHSVCQTIYQNIHEHPGCIDLVSRNLVDLAITNRSQDNISVIVVLLKKPNEITKPWSMDAPEFEPYLTSNNLMNLSNPNSNNGLKVGEDDFGPETDVDALDDAMWTKPIDTNPFGDEVSKATLPQDNPFQANFLHDIVEEKYVEDSKCGKEVFNGNHIFGLPQSPELSLPDVVNSQDSKSPEFHPKSDSLKEPFENLLASHRSLRISEDLIPSLDQHKTNDILFNSEAKPFQSISPPASPVLDHSKEDFALAVTPNPSEQFEKSEFESFEVKEIVKEEEKEKEEAVVIKEVETQPEPEPKLELELELELEPEPEPEPEPQPQPEPQSEREPEPELKSKAEAEAEAEEDKKEDADFNSFTLKNMEMDTTSTMSTTSKDVLETLNDLMENDDTKEVEDVAERVFKEIGKLSSTKSIVIDEIHGETSFIDSVGTPHEVVESGGDESEEEWNYYKGGEKVETIPTDNMATLNPDAAEFVPTTTAESEKSLAGDELVDVEENEPEFPVKESETNDRVTPVKKTFVSDIVDDVVISSPNWANMDAVEVPDEDTFLTEIKSRPGDILEDESKPSVTVSEPGIEPLKIDDFDPVNAITETKFIESDINHQTTNDSNQIIDYGQHQHQNVLDEPNIIVEPQQQQQQQQQQLQQQPLIPEVVQLEMKEPETEPEPRGLDLAKDMTSSFIDPSTIGSDQANQLVETIEKQPSQSKIEVPEEKKEIIPLVEEVVEKVTSRTSPAKKPTTTTKTPIKATPTKAAKTMTSSLKSTPTAKAPASSATSVETKVKATKQSTTAATRPTTTTTSRSRPVATVNGEAAATKSVAEAKKPVTSSPRPSAPNRPASGRLPTGTSKPPVVANGDATKKPEIKRVPLSSRTTATRPASAPSAKPATTSTTTVPASTKTTAPRPPTAIKQPVMTATAAARVAAAAAKKAAGSQQTATKVNGVSRPPVKKTLSNTKTSSSDNKTAAAANGPANN